jgi:hypothetical protein
MQFTDSVLSSVFVCAVNHKENLLLVSMMRGLLKPVSKHASWRPGRAYVTYGHVRLRSCRRWGGGGACENPHGRRRSRLDSRTPPSEIDVAPPVASRLIS